MSAKPVLPETVALPTSPPASLRFGPDGRFELQSAERRLFVDGRPAALGARALDLLITLAAQPDHLLSKSELLDRVWPGLVVEEANLQMQISNLRKVLGSEAIATVPGRGYRFALPVGPAATAPAAPAAPAAPNAASVTAPIAAPRHEPRLFGRDSDLAQLEVLLQNRGCVSLVGPAGVGKTSLARAAAARAPGRCVWVDVAPLTRGDQVAGALARALEAPLAEGDPAPQLQRALEGQALLLVFDNAEHLVEACAALATLLAPLPALRLLVTSQLPLAVAGERVQRLEPLAVGDGALALLVDRIVAADRRATFSAPAMATLGDICKQLDGLPLALEMAAARVPLIGVQGVHDALAERFALLTRGQRDAAARHRTLHNALDWSYRLLDAHEQRLFRALGAFAGGFTLELAVALMSEGDDTPDSTRRWAVIDGLTALAERSLVAVSTDDPPRYRLLDTMRAFALQEMAASTGEHEAVRGRHAAAMAALFWRFTPADRPHTERWMPELENVREAIDWARTHDLGRAAQLTARATSLGTFSVWLNECAAWLRSLQPAMASPAGDALPAEVQATWWTELARVSIFRGDAQAGTAARRAVALWQPLQRSHDTLFATVVWVRASREPGAELDEACAMLQAQIGALPDATARDHLMVNGALTQAAFARKDHAAVLEGRLAEMRLAQELGNDAMAEAAESNVVSALTALGRYAEAAACGEALLARIDRRGDGDGDANLPWLLSSLIEALVLQGRSDAAQALVPRANATGRRLATIATLPVLPWLATSRGRHEAAARLLGHVRQRFESSGAGLQPDENELLQRAQAAAEAVLGAPRVDALMRIGRALTDEAAEALAAGDD
jgi:predicted ATPase/DNA-binding winged helix-turn-helix (wHTH) protein